MRRVLLFTYCLFVLSACFAANKLKPVASIPFEMVGTYVVIKAKINDSSPLNLIFDTGIHNTIITELQQGDHISLNYSNVKEMMGLGGGDHLQAYTSNSNSLKIKKINLENKKVFVLKEDVFNLSKHSGTKINGLIGIDLLQDYVVEVNYSSKHVNFYDNKSFVAPADYEKLPLSVESSKMFIELSVLESDSVRRQVKMLIDTGAELNAWFQTFKQNSVQLPRNGIKCTIGQGLNGVIYGQISRLHQIRFGKYSLENPIVSFPDSASISELIGNSDRDGTIGSQLLSRFNYIIDYSQQQFYFKPNSNFNNKFNYNIAGIEVAQFVPNFPVKEVWRVWDNSPAAKAGILNDDQLLEINDERAIEMSVSEIKAKFETPSKYPLRIKVSRGGKELNFEIDMKPKI